MFESQSSISIIMNRILPPFSDSLHPQSTNNELKGREITIVFKHNVHANFIALVPQSGRVYCNCCKVNTR